MTDFTQIIRFSLELVRRSGQILFMLTHEEFPQSPGRGKLLAVLVVIVWVGVGLSGCAWFRPRPFSPFPPGAVPEAGSKEDIVRQLQNRQDEVTTLKADAKIKARGDGIKGTLFVEATVLHRSPADLRLRFRRLMRVFAQMLVTGQSCAVLLPDEEKYFVGPLSVFDDDPQLFFGLRPDVLIRAVTVEKSVARALEAPDAPPLLQSGKDWIVRESLDKGRTRIVYFLRREDLLTEQVGIYREGRLVAHVTYENYILADGRPFPGAMEIRLPQAGTKARIELSKYIINPSLSPVAVFEMPPPDGVEIHNLSDLSLATPPTN
ncbi:MAG: hypothetical protein V2A74_00345 [bacterium]